ncbi:MAG: phosphopantothenoylcysteine decarboxylase [Verrucomicrobiota bacterium]
MNCIVTAGPTYENLDKVRRLTNFSTGRLGIELANYLVDHGHDVVLLAAEQTSHPGPRRAQRIETFTTTADLHDRLENLAGPYAASIFHAAAVSDYTFGKLWLRSPQGDLSEIKAGKIATRQGTLLAELVPTPKIIHSLRDWFPKSKIVGWKYEVDGNRAAVLKAASRQISECLTDICVANGPAYGEGFGIVSGTTQPHHVDDRVTLYEWLERLVR